MSMSPEVQAEYDSILREIVLSKGTLVSTGGTYYGWIADDWQHGKKCKLTSVSTPNEITYSEFAGTFATSDYTRHAVEIDGVTCACGEIGSDRRVRWNSSMSEVAEAVFEEMYKRMGKKTEKKAGTDRGGNFSDDVDTTPGGVPWNYN